MSRKSARIAMSIANSPLVKTARSRARTPIGGRVVMAVGKDGEPADRDRLAISFGDIRVAANGMRDPIMMKRRLSAYMKNERGGHHGRSRARQGRGPGAHLRSHQGICRHQRRLPLMKLTLVVACALVDADGRVLVAQRRRARPRGPVGVSRGKMEAGERPEETLIRELKEELGITVKEACLAPLTFASYAYDSFHLLMPLWICRRWRGPFSRWNMRR